MWTKISEQYWKCHYGIRKFLLRLFLLPMFGGFATICGVFAGYLGSHYDAIVFSSYYPFFWPGVETIRWEATSFDVLTWIFGMSFTGTYWAQAVTSKQANEETRQALDRLVTVPPRGFLESYRTLSVLFFDFSDNFMAVIRALEIATASAAAAPAPATIPAPLAPGELAKAIRTQLEFILKVFSAYDSSNSADTIYAANIMLYIGTANPAFAPLKPALEGRMKCVDRHADIGKLSGVLDLQLALSARTDSGVFADDKLTAMALPVPKPLPGQRLSESKDLIPGAPFAFATQKSMIYGEQQGLFDTIEASGNFTDDVKKELREILQAQSRDVQTLVCIPIYPPGAPTPATEPIAILNIHKNKVDKHATEKYGELLPLLGVMTRVLGNFVAEL